MYLYKDTLNILFFCAGTLEYMVFPCIKDLG